MTDDAKLTATDVMLVTVNPGAISNQPPVASAGPDQVVNEGDTVILDYSGSHDPDGTSLSFGWSGPVQLTQRPRNMTSQFVAPNVGQDTVLTFRLKVTDSQGAVSEDVVKITVKNTGANIPPVAMAGPDQVVNEGDRVILDFSGSHDPDGTSLSFGWRGPLTLTKGSRSLVYEFTAPAVTQDKVLTWHLTVTDSQGASHEDSVNITVRNVK